MDNIVSAPKEVDGDIQFFAIQKQMVFYLATEDAVEIICVLDEDPTTLLGCSFDHQQW